MVYETILPNGKQLKFEYDETKKYSHVEVYIDGLYWGIPEGSIFIKQLLIDLEKKK